MNLKNPTFRPISIICYIWGKKKGEGKRYFHLLMYAHRNSGRTHRKLIALVTFGEHGDGQKSNGARGGI